MLIVDVLKKLAASANYWSKKFKEFKNIQKSKKQVYAKNKRAWNKLMGEVMLEHRSIMNYDKHQTIENKKLVSLMSCIFFYPLLLLILCCVFKNNS